MNNEKYIELIPGNVISYESKISLKNLIENIEFQRMLFDLNEEELPTEEEVTNTAMFFIKNFPLNTIYTYRLPNGRLQVIKGNQELIRLYFFYKGIYIKPKNSTSSIKIKDVFNKQCYDKSTRFEDTVNKDYEIVKHSYKVYDTENKNLLDINFSDLPSGVQEIADKTSTYVINLNPSQEDFKEDIFELYKDTILG